MLDPTAGRAQRRDRPRPLLRTTLGEVLRRTRQEQRRTLADVARAARVSMPYLSEVERGRKEASSEVLAAICGALHVELADLLIEAGRELVGGARVYRLDTAGGRRISPPVHRSGSGPGSRSGEARCLLAA